MKDFILYDDRGILNPDEATILTTYPESPDQEHAFHQAVADFECGWALYEGDALIAWQMCEQRGFARWTAWWKEDVREFDIFGNRKLIAKKRRRAK
jgi:hypothetical protein